MIQLYVRERELLKQTLFDEPGSRGGGEGGGGRIAGIGGGVVALSIR
jgi:hypothetical protein